MNHTHRTREACNITQCQTLLLYRVNCDVFDDFSTATVQLYISSCVRHQSHRPRQLAVRSRAENLDRQTGAAARVISDTRKFDRDLKRFLHEDLHWLDVPQRVTYKLYLLVFKCLHGLARPLYLAEGCVPVADVTPRRKLRSATRGLLDFHLYNMKNYGRPAFSYAGSHARNSLPEHLRQSTSIAFSSTH